MKGHDENNSYWKEKAQHVEPGPMPEVRTPRPTDAGFLRRSDARVPTPGLRVPDVLEGSSKPLAAEPEVPQGGIKYDQGKLRLDLLPVSLIEGVGAVLTYGAQKYSDRNWEKGLKWSRVFGALMRHLWAYWRGEELDPDSHLPHLWCAGCCIAFLIEYRETHRELDDRPVSYPCPPTLGQ